MSLSVEGVSHHYDSRRVLDDVSLVVEIGEAVAITGPSGSGKTTLLGIAGLLMRPTSGSITIDGHPVPDSSRQRDRLRASKLGWVFQTTNVVGRRSTLDNVALGLLAHGADRSVARRRAAELLDGFGLGARASAPASSLSGGEVQRLCIARALASPARYLLADEPTGNLDRSSTLSVVEALNQASGHDVGLIVATHDPLIAAGCQRVLELVDGRLRPKG